MKGFIESLVSIHATLAGGDLGITLPPKGGEEFLSTPPSRVATQRVRLCGCGILEFLSTPPSRVATSITRIYTPCYACFYPRHPRGWRRCARFALYQYNAVSIHATLAGGDVKGAHYRVVDVDVSIHATLAGGDVQHNAPKHQAHKFLSTPPSRVATGTLRSLCACSRVSIHATLAGGDNNMQVWIIISNVSIHATLAGGDR